MTTSLEPESGDMDRIAIRTETFDGVVALALEVFHDGEDGPLITGILTRAEARMLARLLLDAADVAS